ncbi:MAG: thioredoxin [Chloroflexi bacterium HGW-Chloroflexi-1]|nr:MAG: thioredoxin [Chloroflexi bacterium HGW-Chloroflexi-1]
MGGGQDESEERAGGVEPRHVTGAEFDTEILGSELPTVVDFWAEWCGPCHAIAPAVKELANEFDGRAVVAKLNADDYPDILSRYGIMGIPTLIYFKNGQEVDRVTGMTRYGVLKDKLERLLY